MNRKKDKCLSSQELKLIRFFQKVVPPEEGRLKPHRYLQKFRSGIEDIGKIFDYLGLATWPDETYSAAALGTRPPSSALFGRERDRGEPLMLNLSVRPQPAAVSGVSALRTPRLV
jgi:hypothetical protein